MATAALPFLLLAASLLLSPAAAAAALKCKSQKIPGNYSNCADLPTLNSFLHWSYDQTNSTLSVAFSAAPPSSNGWIAWALNPNGDGMKGAQSFLAYKSENGSVVVKTLSIGGYDSIVESKLSFEVLEKKADFSGGVMRIFAKLVFPAGRTSMNYIWQVGSSVKNGVPAKHDFGPENLNAKAVLEVVKGGKTPAPAPAPASGSGGSGVSPSTTPANGASRSTSGWWFQLGGFFLMCGVSVFGF